MKYSEYIFIILILIIIVIISASEYHAKKKISDAIIIKEKRLRWLEMAKEGIKVEQSKPEEVPDHVHEPIIGGKVKRD
jgi:hypothetical protein